MTLQETVERAMTIYTKLKETVVKQAGGQPADAAPMLEFHTLNGKVRLSPLVTTGPGQTGAALTAAVQDMMIGEGPPSTLVLASEVWMRAQDASKPLPPPGHLGRAAAAGDVNVREMLHVVGMDASGEVVSLSRAFRYKPGPLGVEVEFGDCVNLNDIEAASIGGAVVEAMREGLGL